MRAYRLCAVLLCFVGGCSFNPPGSDVDFGVGDLSGGSPDLPPGSGDGGGDRDMTSGPVCVPAATSCLDDSTLQTCNGNGTATATTMCPLGCGTDGGTAHCKVLVPTAPVKSGDLDGSDLSTPAANTGTRFVFDVSNGAINNSADANAPVRMKNSGNAREVHQGIAFRITNGVAIWSFKTLTIPAGVTVVFDNSAANNAVALVSSTDAEIDGTIDARGYQDATAMTVCTSNNGGPGGTAGATSGVPAIGDGAGGSAAGTLVAGGGGAGYGATGGAGGIDPMAIVGTAGAAGATGGGAELSPIRGGYGGGYGAANGGGGGGGIQIVVNGTLTLGNKAVVNVGGCGGFAGAVNGGGGGGSGGAVLAEALAIAIPSGATISANGGGGGGGGDLTGTTAGDPGGAGGSVAAGGKGPNMGSAGGNGGAAKASATGQPGEAGSGLLGSGGGGGGVGRIRLNSQSGSGTLGGNTLSPTLAQTLATQGTVVIK